MRGNEMHDYASILGSGGQRGASIEDYFNVPKQIVMGQSMWLLTIIIITINLWPPLN
jgi:hypothetical protein